MEYDDKFTDTTKRDKGTDFHAGMDAYYKEMFKNGMVPEVR